VKLLKKILKPITHCYSYGKNNKIVFLKNGKETKKFFMPKESNINIKGNNNKVVFVKNSREIKNFFMPKGLNINIKGNNNNVILELPIKFADTKFSLSGDNNTLSIKKTDKILNDVAIFLSEFSELYIDENASIGQGNFYLVANGNYKNSHKVVIGKNFRAGKDTIIRTSDGHSIIDPETNMAVNEPQDVIIGDNVWLMSRCMVAKGAKIPNNTGVAAYSFVNKKFDEENILLAGIPAKIIKHNFKWDIRSYGKYMRDMEKENVEV